MKLMRTLLCAAVLGAMSVPAVAAPAKSKAKAKKATPAKVIKAKKAKKAKKARQVNKAQRIKKYEFLGDELQGDIVSPDGDEVRARVGAKFTNLIKVRLSFLPEITKEGENL